MANRYYNMGKHRAKNLHKNKTKTVESVKQIKSNKKIEDADPRGWLKRAFANIQDNVAEHAQSLYSHHLKKHNSQLRNKKQNMNRSLDLLKAEQSMIREKLREIKQIQKMVKPTPKFQIYKPTIKTDSELKEITKRYRKFKHDLVQKSKLIKQQEQRYKQNQALLKEEHLKAECEERRKKIEETLEKMAIRRKQRLEEHKKEKKILKELKKKKLFEKMKENFNKKMNDINEEKQLEYEKKRLAYRVDMGSLSAHEQKHDQQFQEREEKRSIRLAQSRLLPTIHHYRSRFYDNMLDHDEEQKQKLKEAKERGKLLLEKHRKYQQYVTSEFVPKQKENFEGCGSQIKDEKKVEPLEYKQMVKRGNQYLKQSHKQNISLQKRKQLQKMKSLERTMQNQRKPYPNYLSQLSKNSSTHKALSNTYDGELSRIKTILNDENINRQKKIGEVKTAVEKMSFTYQPSKHSSEEQLLSNINAKMKLLKILQ